MDRIRRIPYIEIFPLVVLTIIAYRLISNFDVVMGWMGTFLGILTPFIWAFAISFVLGPVIDMFEVRMKFKRVAAVVSSYVLMIGVIVLIVTLLVPIIALNINDIIANTPGYLNQLQRFLVINASKYEALTKIDYSKMLDFNNMGNLMGEVGKYFNVFTGVVKGVVGFTSGIIKFLLGMIISIYFLLDREKFKDSFSKTLNAFFSDSKASAVSSFFTEANVLFSKYLIGQATDSCVVAFIGFIGFSVIGTPYAVLMAIVLGFTNMIPFFGPIIGIIPIVGITLFTSPITALYTMIFILVLQQIDGNIIAPNIVGGSVGVTPFWSILAILIGGSLFGIVGMIVCIPTFALFRNVFLRYVDTRIAIKRLKQAQEEQVV